MSANERHEINQSCQLSFTPLCAISSVSSQDCSKVTENGIQLSPIDRELFSRYTIDKSVPNIHKENSNSPSIADPTLYSEPSSGFMLLSVKRLSKVKRLNRTRSASLLLSRQMNDENSLANRNNVESSSRDDSSHTNSSPGCEEEEEGLEDFPGSGSIEAEEFEDDDVDESEGANEDDSTTVVVNAAAKATEKSSDAQHVPSNQILNAIRPSQVNSSTQTGSRSDTPIGHRDHFDLGFAFPEPQCHHKSPKIPRTLPLGFSLPACDRHFEFFGQGAQDPCANIPPEATVRYNSVIPSHEHASFLPSLLTNSSHYQTDLGVPSPAQKLSSIQTAPVSGHGSPVNSEIPAANTTTETVTVPGPTPLCPPRPHPSSVSLYYDTPSSLSLVAAAAAAAAVAVSAAHAAPASAIGTTGLAVNGVTGLSNWSNSPGMVRPSLVHSPYNLPISNAQPHHAFPGLPLTCPLHPHSAGSSDVRSTQMISKTEADQLSAEVVAISTASLPSLQPASRFRKARIHETVEQWCHGRLSVHDCHLKVIPDWVLDLQKKSSVLEQDISNALSQRVNCFSCLEQKVLDRSGLQQTVGPKGSSDPHPHPASSKADESHIRRVISRDTARNNLFSFWDSGSRVYCRLPKSTRLCIPPGVSESSSDLPPQPELGGAPCADAIVTGVGESNENCTKPANRPCQAAADSTTELRYDDEDDRVLGTSALEGVSPAPAIFLPSNSADPATAYLRRQQVVAGSHLNYLSAQHGTLAKAGDSPSADELSLPLSDVMQSSPGSTDYTNQSLHREPPPFQVTRAVTHHCNNENSRVQEPQSFLVRKRPVLDSVPVMVPPTSPTFVDAGAGEPGTSSASEDKHFGIATSTMLNGTGLTDVPPVLPKIQRIMNGGECVPKMPSTNVGVQNYQNMMPQFVSNGFTDPRSDSMKPSSSLPSPTASLQSNVPYPNCSDATAFLCEPVLPGTSAVNGEIGAQPLSPSGLLADQSAHQYNLKEFPNRSTYPSGSLPSILPTKGIQNNGLDRDTTRDSKLSNLLSTRLEARINESLESIRAGLVNTVRDELVSAFTEAADLLAEVDRLREEVIRLRGYQAAFYALRPFVSAELWDHLNTQQARLQLLQSTPSVVPVNPSNSVPATSAPSILPNSPQHLD